MRLQPGIAAGLVLSALISGASLSPVGQPGQPVELLTGVTACWAGGEQATFGGVLVADPTFGTAMNGRPIMWPVGFSGAWRADGEVAVMNRDGKVLATTGRVYWLASAPVWGVTEDKRASIGGLNVFLAAGDCYPWDLVPG